MSSRLLNVNFVFFFQAEDGIRDTSVTGVQTCALPICPINFGDRNNWWGLLVEGFYEPNYQMPYNFKYYKIGRASCRERV